MLVGCLVELAGCLVSGQLATSYCLRPFLQISTFYFPTFKKADCSTFALSVGRTTSPLNFLLKKISYFSFPVLPLLHKKDIFLLQILSKDGTAMRDLHCLLGLVNDSILSFRSVCLLVF